MEHVVLGRSGLSVSVVGLGCGGPRLGQERGMSVEHSMNIIHEALDLGVNLIDMSQNNRTEAIVGKALAGRRDSVVLTTKIDPTRKDGTPVDGPMFRRAFEESLRNLRTDTIDVLYLHAVGVNDYERCVAVLVPELERLRDQGAIRAIAISEKGGTEFKQHKVLQMALDTGCWDVVMVGFNFLDMTARHTILPRTMRDNVGVEVMFAARYAVEFPMLLRDAAARAVADGRIDADEFDLNDPVSFLVHEGGASTIVEAAYRFVRHEPGCHVVLSATASLEHLRANVQSINLGPLPSLDRQRLAMLFDY